VILVAYHPSLRGCERWIVQRVEDPLNNVIALGVVTGGVRTNKGTCAPPTGPETLARTVGRCY